MELEKIKEAKTKWLGKEIKYYKSIDSTQEEAQRLRQEVKSGTLVIAENQTAGIGTKGRNWQTQEGKNITMTLVIFPQCLVKEMTGITTKIAQCMVGAIQELYQINIKQPNDLLLNGKKIAGILTQSSSLNGRVNELIIGIGFNVNQMVFAEELQDIATSLKKEYNKEYEREKIIVNFLEKLEPILEAYKKK